MSESEEHL